MQRMTDVITTQRKAIRKPRKDKGSLLFVRIPEAVKVELEAIARHEDRSLSSVARFAFREYIERHSVEPAEAR